MICPYCNGEMELGYIDQTRILIPLIWYPVNREQGFFKSTKKDIKLTSAIGGAAPTYYCEKCRKFIIDQDDLTVKKKNIT